MSDEYESANINDRSGGNNIEAGHDTNISGDVVGRDKNATFDQRGQQVGSQINVAGDYVVLPAVRTETVDRKDKRKTELDSLEWLERLDAFELKDEDSDTFGKSVFTSELVFGSLLGLSESEPFADASFYVVLAAVPVGPIGISPTEILAAAQKMLEPASWYNPQTDPDRIPPRYWSPVIFDISNTTRRAAKKSFVWEHNLPASLLSTQCLPEEDKRKFVLSRVAVTASASVLFASAIRFAYKLKNGTTIFRLGRILAECWMFAGLVAQLQHNVGYGGQTGLCIGMVNTNGSHLGDFADKWLEPDDAGYWRDAILAGNDYSCHSPNLRFCETVSLLSMRPKEQPEFIRRFGEAISLAYNHDIPRCFEKKTGLVPKRYFDRY